MSAARGKRSFEESDDDHDEHQPRSSKVHKSSHEPTINFEGLDLLAIKGTTVSRYALAVARKLWPEPAKESDSLWYRRIVNRWGQKSTSNARPPFKGPKNELKIKLLAQAVKYKFNVDAADWPETWELVK